MKTCAICHKPLTTQQVVCSNACHLEQLRRNRLDPIKAEQINARISYMVRLSHSHADVKARMSEGQKRRFARA